MTVIVMGRTSLSITQYNDVTNIAFNGTTYTITYTSGGSTLTATATKAGNTIHIMES